jgi:type IV pilus assembly protein PilP
MEPVSKFSWSVLTIAFWMASGFELLIAQEHIQTPSQKTAEALERLTKTPATIGKSLGALTEAANAKLKQVFGDKAETKTSPESDDTSALLKKPEPEPSKYIRRVNRDPFRPPSIQARTSKRSRDNLSPLERFELGQLKLVGIIWDVKEPRAMIEDTAGLGYTILVGTPIGGGEGKVKAIHRNQVVVEESFEDFSGKKKTREVFMKLSTDQTE